MRTEISKIVCAIGIIFLSIIVVVNPGCKRTQFFQITSSKEIYDIHGGETNQKVVNNDFVLIYYFDGGCGQCLLNVKQISSLLVFEFPEIKAVFISASILNQEAKRMITNLSIDDVIFQENVDIIITRKKELVLNNVLLINNNNRLIFSSMHTNEDYLRKALTNIIK